MLSIKPVGFRVIVDPSPVEKESAGGIIIVTNEREEMTLQQMGTLVAVSPLAWKDWGDGTPWAKVGDVVTFVQHSWRKIKDTKTGKDYFLLNDQDITGVIEND